MAKEGNVMLGVAMTVIMSVTVVFWGVPAISFSMVKTASKSDQGEPR